MTKEIISKDSQVSDFDIMCPPAPDESRLLIGCLRDEYSASAIARAVEDCNAHVLNLNVTAISTEMADLVIELRVNHRNVEAISRSLMRYGFNVLDAQSGAEDVNERLRERANELLRYLSI